MFITESWFWRGTQSAIFYYVSCSPWVEHKYKRQRRKEAQRAEKEKADIIIAQPGLIMQPGPFQTNPDWAEEIICGPGPPKGWKKDKMLQGFTEDARERYRIQSQAPQPPSMEMMHTNIDTSQDFAYIAKAPPALDGTGTPTIKLTKPRSVQPVHSATAEEETIVESISPISEIISAPSMDTSIPDELEHAHRGRPSVERRLSSAVENIKGTIKGWNLRRYEREDEVLSGLNERLTKIWDKAANYGAETGAEIRKLSFPYGRKRAGTTATAESERVDYQRAVRNPEINELHPAIVSPLPATRDEAVWMLLPPPSAAVMAGRCRPQEESALRWPLAQIGKSPDEWEQLKKARELARAEADSRSRSSTNDSKKTPDLSNSSSEESWSDEEYGAESYFEDQKRHSAPVEGWIPVKPKPSAKLLYPPSPHWQEQRANNKGKAKAVHDRPMLV